MNTQSPHDDLPPVFAVLPTEGVGKHIGALVFESAELLKRVCDEEREHLIKYRIILTLDVWILVNPVGITAVIKKNPTVEYSIFHNPFLAALTQLLYSRADFPKPKNGSEREYPLVDHEGRVLAMHSCRFTDEGIESHTKEGSGTDTMLAKIASALFAQQQTISGPYLTNKAAEKYLAEIAQYPFSAMLAYTKIKYHAGSIEKEVCDFLVVFQDTAIIWQVKGLKLDPKTGRHKPSEIAKNQRQLLGARQSLLNPEVEVEAFNYIHGTHALDCSRIKKVYLISAMLGMEEQGPTDSIVQMNDQAIYQFNKRNLDMILRELDTISDFLGYLDDRALLQENISKGTVSPAPFTEKGLLAHYVRTGGLRDLWEKRTATVDDDNYLDTTKYQDARKKVNDDIFWDGLILSAIKSCAPDSEHAGNIAELLRPRRNIRAELSRNILSCLSKLATRQKSGVIWASYPCLRTTFGYIPYSGPTPTREAIDTILNTVSCSLDELQGIRLSKKILLIVDNRKEGLRRTETLVFDVTSRILT